MPIQAQFEEKTFETYFGHELTRRIYDSFSPGQIAEAYLGFDAAFLLPWHDLPWPIPLFGPWWVRAEPGISLHDLTHLLDHVCARLPDVKFNLFVQYKRPERVVGHRAAEWTVWKAPYYRYEIRKKQQNVLSDLDSQSGDRAIVVYASPAYIKSRTLFRFARERRIIPESNIAPVASLNGHSRFTYTRPGSKGVACTDPVEVEGPTLETILEDATSRDAIPYIEHLLWTSRVIEESVKSDEALSTLDDARRAILSLYTLAELSVERDTVLYAILTIRAFSDLTSSRLSFLYSAE